MRSQTKLGYIQNEGIVNKPNLQTSRAHKFHRHQPTNHFPIDIANRFKGCEACCLGHPDSIRHEAIAKQTGR